MSKPRLPGVFGGRSVEEWIGKTPDSIPPDRVKDRIFLRYDGRCYLTGRKLRKGEYDFDHIDKLDGRGENRESNIAPVYRPAHREKTARENSEDDKADRIRRKTNGTWKRKGRKLQSRGFPKTRPIQEDAQ